MGGERSQHRHTRCDQADGRQRPQHSSNKAGAGQEDGQEQLLQTAQDTLNSNSTAAPPVSRYAPSITDCLTHLIHSSPSASLTSDSSHQLISSQQDTSCRFHLPTVFYQLHT